MKKSCFILLLIIVTCNPLFSQVKANDPDSVDIILSSPLPDSAKASAMLKIISDLNASKNYDLAKVNSIKAFNYFKGEKNVLYFIQLSEPYGDAYYKLKDFDSAVIVFKNSIDLAEQISENEKKKQLKAKFNSKAAKAIARISYDSSITYYNLSHEYYLSFKNNHTDSFEHVNCYSMLAYSYLMTGNAKKGYEIAEQAAKMADELNDNQMKSQSYTVLGTILNELNLFDKAVSTLQIAAEAALAANDSIKAGQSYNSIALVYLKQNKFPDALKYYYRALEYINKNNSSFQYVIICHNVIAVLCELDSVKRAEYFLKELTENVTAIKSDNNYFDALNIICTYYIKSGNLPKADEFMKKATEILPSFKAHHQLMNYYSTQAKLFEAKGDYKRTVESMRLHHAYKDSISTAETEEMVAEKNTIYETEKKEQQIILLEKDNELKTTRELRSKQVRNFSFAGIAALIIFGAFTYYRYRQRKHLSEKLATSLTELKETQQQLIKTERLMEQESVRMRLSRDLHDDIGSTLSSINMLSHSAKKRMAEKDSVKLSESLEKIGERTQSTLDKMSDIIWSIKPENDSLANIFSRMREYADNVLESNKINYTINFPTDNDHVHLLPDLKNNMYLIFKEAVNNLAKYSQCSKANIELKIEDKKIVMTIEDNGVGFDSSNGLSGNGLNNMKRRAQESGAHFNITSEKGKGTHIEFIKNI